MNSSHRIAMALGLALLPGAASAEALDVKAGLWESTVTQPFQGFEKTFEKRGESCKRSVIAATSTRWQGKIECTGKSRIVSELLIEALSRENARGKGATQASDRAHDMSVNATFSAKWLSASCDQK